MSQVQRGDWVTCKAEGPHGRSGYVTRRAKDGSWADVCWGPGWHKRMPTSSLTVQHTIERGGWKITDITRQRELEGETTR